MNNKDLTPLQLDYPLQHINEAYRRFCFVAQHFDAANYDTLLHEAYSDFRQSTKWFREAGIAIEYDGEMWKLRESEVGQ